MHNRPISTPVSSSSKTSQQTHITAQTYPPNLALRPRTSNNALVTENIIVQAVAGLFESNEEQEEWQLKENGTGKIAIIEERTKCDVEYFIQFYSNTIIENEIPKKTYDRLIRPGQQVTIEEQHATGFCYFLGDVEGNELGMGIGFISAFEAQQFHSTINEVLRRVTRQRGIISAPSGFRVEAHISHVDYEQKVDQKPEITSDKSSIFGESRKTLTSRFFGKKQKAKDQGPIPQPVAGYTVDSDSKSFRRNVQPSTSDAKAGLQTPPVSPSNDVTSPVVNEHARPVRPYSYAPPPPPPLPSLENLSLSRQTRDSLALTNLTSLNGRDSRYRPSMYLSSTLPPPPPPPPAIYIHRPSMTEPRRRDGRPYTPRQGRDQASHANPPPPPPPPPLMDDVVLARPQSVLTNPSILNHDMPYRKHPPSDGRGSAEASRYLSSVPSLAPPSSPSLPSAQLTTFEPPPINSNDDIPPPPPLPPLVPRLMCNSKSTEQTSSHPYQNSVPLRSQQSEMNAASTGSSQHSFKMQCPNFFTQVHAPLYYERDCPSSVSVSPGAIEPKFKNSADIDGRSSMLIPPISPPPVMCPTPPKQSTYAAMPCLDSEKSANSIRSSHCSGDQKNSRTLSDVRDRVTNDVADRNNLLDAIKGAGLQILRKAEITRVGTDSLQSEPDHLLTQMARRRDALAENETDEEACEEYDDGEWE